jgi:hypothetical protein
MPTPNEKNAIIDYLVRIIMVYSPHNLGAFLHESTKHSETNHICGILGHI